MYSWTIDEQRKAEFTRKLESIKDGFIVISTGKYIGEGFDENRLDTLFLTMPFRWRGTLQQYIGRLSRLKKGKNEIIVYDYADIQSKYFSQMYLERLKGYKQMGFLIESKMQLDSVIYHSSDYLQRLYEDLASAREITLFIRYSQEEKVSKLIKKCAVDPEIYSDKEMGLNMIIVDKRTIWYGSINPFVNVHKKNDDILRYEDALLAKQLLEKV